MNSENDRLALLISLLDDVDFHSKDEQKLIRLKAELLNCFARSGCVSLICTAFESGLRQDMYKQGNKNLESFASSICNILALSGAECVALAYSLTQSQFRVYAADAFRIIKTKCAEINSFEIVANVHMDLLTSVAHYIQSSEELSSPAISENFLKIVKAKASPAFHGQLGGLGLSLTGDMGPGARGVSVAQVLREVGPHCSANAESFRSTLHSIGQKIDEEQMAALIVIMPARAMADNEEKQRLEMSGQQYVPWNLEVVADVLYQECRGLNWTLVAKHLDHQALVIRSEQDYQLLSRFFVRVAGCPIPAAGLLAQNWNNRAAQFAVLTLAANSPRNIVDFSALIAADQLIQGDGITTPPNFSWLCLLLYPRFFFLAACGMGNEVVDVLTKAAGNYPEYFLVSLSQVQDSAGSGVRSDLLRKLLPLFTGLQGSRPTYLSVMRKLHSVNPDILVLLCRIAFKKARKLWEIASIDTLLTSLGGPIVRKLEEEGTTDELMSYYCVKADKGELNLEEKVISLLEGKPQNARVFITFVKQHIESLRLRGGASSDALLSFESCAVLLRAAQNFPTVVPLEELRTLAALYTQQQQALQQQQQQHIMSMQLQQPNPQNPQQQNPAPSGSNFPPEAVELVRLPPGPEATEIEGIANQYFKKIYTTDQNVLEVITLLKQFKGSSEKRDQEVFRCMVHNLFDEYRFYHKYPEKELLITGRLFGAVIYHQLVSSITLGIALRYVLEALRKNPDEGEVNDKMFRFGRTALDQIRTRLGEWPQYCSHLVQIPHLARHYPDLYQEAQRALANPQSAPMGGPTMMRLDMPHEELSLGSNGSSLVRGSPLVGSVEAGMGALSQQLSGMGMSRPLMGNSPVSNHSTPLSMSLPQGSSSPMIAPLPAPVVPVAAALPAYEDPKEEDSGMSEIQRMALVNGDVLNTTMPPEQVRDQIHFIINNIAKSNFEAKTGEIKSILQPDHYNWFANYLVVKRISTQPNLHPLYLSVLDALGFSALLKLVLDSAYHNVTKLLQSPNITTSSSERSLLRNLGVWLGQMTLARNRPLLQRRINLKELLFWGFETGRLIAVCSFVAKIVEGAKDSKVFRPPNPWLLAILGIMRELYEIEDLKLNIKFEVQVLCKNINIKIEDIPRGSELSRRRAPAAGADGRNPDFNQKAPTAVGSRGSSPVVTQSPSEPSQPLSSPQHGGIAGDAQLQALLASLPASVVISPSVQYFATNPAQRRLVAVAVERGVREVLGSAVDRSVAIAATTTKHLLLKDFATEPNEQNLRNGAHLMAGSLAASLAVATCKEPLRVAIGNHLRTLLAQAISDPAAVDQIVQVCANDNVDLGALLVEKTCVEKALREIDDALAGAFQARRSAREAGQLFVDHASLGTGKYPNELPEALKPRVGGLSPHQLHVYEAFARARMASATAARMQAGAPTPVVPEAKSPQGPVLSMAQALESQQMTFSRIDVALRALQTQLQGREVHIGMLPRDSDILLLLRDLVSITQRTQAGVRNETAMTFSETVFHRMFEGISSPDQLRLEVCVAILEAVRGACGGKAFTPDFISWLGKYASLVSNDEAARKVYRLILILLLRAKLVRCPDLDVYFVTYVDEGRNLFWLELALSFVRQCLVEGMGSIYEFGGTLEVVTKMRPSNPTHKKQLDKWLMDIQVLASEQEQRKATAGAQTGALGAAGAAGTGSPAPRDAARELVTGLLERWLRVWSTVNDQVFGSFLQLMEQYGVLKTEEAADKFFRVATEICVEACLRSASAASPTAASAEPTPPTLNFTVIDALTKLFQLLVRVADKEGSNGSARVNLLSRVLSAVARALVDDHETKKSSGRSFDQRPYYRLLSNMSHDLGVPEPKQEPNPAVFPMLAAYTQVFFALQPSNVPGFAYAWIQLISRRSFMPHLLMAKGQKGWPHMHRLLSAQLLFLQPFLKIGQLSEAMRKLYKGTLRVLLVLLHDFPEFLSDYHLSLCDIIPTNCVQLRNLVLSAFPRSMRLPDPFGPNLKVDVLAEGAQAPRILADFAAPLSSIKGHLENYLARRQPPELPAKLPAILMSNGVYNLPLVTSLVVYVGSLAITQVQAGKCTMAASPAMDIFKQMARTLEPEGSYIVFNVMANQLRYPNSHTHFFSFVLLNLFLEESDYVQQQIARVLLERLIVHRPHPWGLLITFIELIKNPKYGFWLKGFTKSAPEMERVFESIARSCLGPNYAAVAQQQLSGKATA
mmetsp:Transcript_13579/g.30419  ORF Transcript_13579/g.30419 Transcript_13579/m.30419 type:complete len:2214 (+) Transcript_13579:205-6846(+)